uniref:Hepatocyte growth factor-regulated tyrosine kinase substrate n=1 Tax=Heterorhabditis bacteriophora TaxID=37862 RepID=A0A1I7XSE2_HETBA
MSKKFERLLGKCLIKVYCTILNIKYSIIIEAATDSTLLEPNWDGIIACFDSVRAGEVPAKSAMQSIRKRIQHENPHVVIHALLVLDACVKNCGHKIHTEISTREFMEEFKNLGIESKYDNVKNKVLEMLQCWAMAFANKPEYKIVVDTHNLMKLAGFDFPSIKEADAMFMAQVAPDWQDGNECFRCRSEFGLITRKHHCRACGQIFCDKCSSKEMTLPQFGIEKEVRVCDACFEKAMVRSGGEQKVVKSEPGSSSVVGNKDVSEEEKEKILREKEEEDLALALAISQSEAEAKEQERQKNLYSLYNGDTMGGSHVSVRLLCLLYEFIVFILLLFMKTLLLKDATSLSSYNTSEMGLGYKGVGSVAPSIPESPSENSLAADDPLARYLNRDYWQQRKAGSQLKIEEWAGNTGASAPLPSESSVTSAANTVIGTNSPHAELAQLTLVQNGTDIIPAVDEDMKCQTNNTMRWCQELKEQVGVMENRIRSNSARGRPILNDTAIQGLFMRLTELHSQVLARMGKLDEERSKLYLSYYESLQDHLGHISEARLAVNELRQEHERKRQEKLAEEQRLRQAQMKQTLEMMRMKKHTMLLEQREMALQRFQQQELQARRGQNSAYYPIHGYNQPHSASIAPACASYGRYFYNYLCLIILFIGINATTLFPGHPSGAYVNGYANYVPQSQYSQTTNGNTYNSQPQFLPDLNSQTASAAQMQSSNGHHHTSQAYCPHTEHSNETMPSTMVQQPAYVQQQFYQQNYPMPYQQQVPVVGSVALPIAHSSILPQYTNVPSGFPVQQQTSVAATDLTPPVVDQPLISFD